MATRNCHIILRVAQSEDSKRGYGGMLSTRMTEGRYWNFTCVTMRRHFDSV